MDSRSTRKSKVTVFSRFHISLKVFAAVVPVILLAAVFMAGPASALTGGGASGATGEWGTVKASIDSFISSQYVPTADGEHGFLLTSPSLKSRIDSDNNGVYLGEGDDVASAPVLIDVANQSTMIPATGIRCLWNSTCLDSSSVSSLKLRIERRAAAGFGTDVVVYGTNGHAESPVAGGLGAIAHAGGLNGSGAPRVLILKWGRAGWYASGPTYYTNTATLVTPGAKQSYSYATNPNCTGTSPDAELVRCIAQWAISSSGGNVGSGTMPPLSGMQAVDVRSGTVLKTVNGGSLPSIHVPIERLFNVELVALNPLGARKLFVGRTQHVPGIAAMNAEMLGYDATFLQWGIAYSNNTQGEKFTGGAGYPLVSPTPDISAPSQFSVSAGNVTATSVDITRITNEPATVKVEYGTAPGTYPNVVNNTVLNANKTVTISGLSSGTVYYFRVTSYDGQANASNSWEGSSETVAVPVCERPALSLGLGSASSYWADYADYEARILSVDFDMDNGGSSDAYGAAITGAASSAGVTLASPTPVMIGTLPAGSSSTVTLRYGIPAGVAGFGTAVTGEALDWCGTKYIYP